MKIIFLILLFLIFNSITVSGIKTFQVLITGFGPFLNYTTNPSELVSQNLSSTCKGFNIEGYEPFQVCYEGWVVDVNETGVQKVQKYLEQNGTKWDAIIHLGLDDPALELHIELIGANIKASASRSSFDPIVVGGPNIIPSSFNLRQFNIRDLSSLSKVFDQQNEIFSRDAGTYFCNEIYYRTLYVVHETPILIQNGFLPVLFIHLTDFLIFNLAQDIRMVTEISGYLIATSYLPYEPNF
ncbi:hypothetical protein M0811_08011 [Anaeramoeba ignava]|uniref:Pyrrolidone-carboxylate peptidase n=1 Tax=Anaeramoeba ignava TaxID=1746090 RepID=A0A9Q0LL67_ANAIG|nr:hypothetical protein M0811_08011 [Anaeramoeba ignava]